MFKSSLLLSSTTRVLPVSVHPTPAELEPASILHAHPFSQGFSRCLTSLWRACWPFFLVRMPSWGQTCPLPLCSSPRTTAMPAAALAHSVCSSPPPPVDLLCRRQDTSPIPQPHTNGDQHPAPRCWHGPRRGRIVCWSTRGRPAGQTLWLHPASCSRRGCRLTSLLLVGTAAPAPLGS